MNEMIVKMTEHAMYDTTPLRYGVVPPKWALLKNIEYDDIGTQNQKPIEIKRGNKHVVAECYSKETDEFLFNGRFVVGKPRKDDYFEKVITVLSVKTDRSERAVSEIIRDLREKQKIDVEYIINKLHPVYTSGDITSVDLFFDYLLKDGIGEGLKEQEEYIKNLEALSEEKDKQLEEKDKRLQEQERKILEIEKQKPQYKGEGVDASPVMTLKNVVLTTRVNREGRTVRCTKLYFEEPGSPERTMDEWADPNGTITQKARSLIGRKVQTTSWNPNVFKPLNWFRDIYPMD